MCGTWHEYRENVAGGVDGSHCIEDETVPRAPEPDLVCTDDGPGLSFYQLPSSLRTIGPWDCSCVPGPLVGCGAHKSCHVVSVPLDGQ